MAVGWHDVKLLLLGLLGALTAGLMTVAVLHGYREDQRVIRFFAGTGIAGKIDVMGSTPSYLLIADEKWGTAARIAVAADGTFEARLDPGAYRLQLPRDSRSAPIVVPNGECLDMVLDFRLPFVVLEIPGEGWPFPRTA
jgi:hypothetical protein